MRRTHTKYVYILSARDKKPIVVQELSLRFGDENKSISDDRAKSHCFAIQFIIEREVCIAFCMEEVG